MLREREAVAGAAGYSRKPLAQKLGIREGRSLLILHAPEGYARTLGPLPPGVELRRALRGPIDLIHCFATRRAELERELPRLKRALARDGAVWVSWPKRASGVPTDLTEDIVRELALAGGLVDVKVCAVDATWSGLKLVVRVRDR